MEDGERVYQCQSLQNYDQAKNHYTAQYQHLCVSVTDCLKSRLAWSDLQLIHDVIFVLATQGWEKVLDVGDDSVSGEVISDPPMEAIIRLGLRFQHPLESNGVVVEELKDEFHDMITYANQFISLATMDYQSVWWSLYHAPNASSWSNILQLVRLLFTLPVSNGKLERVFSTLKLIKVDKRSSLGNELLDDLLVLNSDRVPLKSFNVLVSGGVTRLEGQTKCPGKNTLHIPHPPPTIFLQKTQKKRVMLVQNCLGSRMTG